MPSFLITMAGMRNLPIQGPPGTGKTDVGAEMILALVDKGKRVGVTANSHKVIGNLLQTVLEKARKSSAAPPRILQRADKEDSVDDPAVLVAKDNKAASKGLGDADILAGTSWLFARPEFANAVDVLFVDEAGQVSLANVAAMSQSASNLVLLGDPQQLRQPVQGVHPGDSGLSALEYILRGAATIKPEAGLFLDVTHRMHKDICGFVSRVVYEGKLESDDACNRQRVDAPGPLAGTGLRYLPVLHAGNRTSSVEEAEAIAATFERLVGGSWTDREGVTRKLTLDDILVVAPYNAQVVSLSAVLPKGAKVGTVDKFQGQQAAVCFYSLATSTPEDIPRSLDFLFEINRLNVAVSRARALAVLVCSPELFRVTCRTPEQMRLVNAICRFVEHAQLIEVPDPPASGTGVRW